MLRWKAVKPTFQELPALLAPLLAGLPGPAAERERLFRHVKRLTRHIVDTYAAAGDFADKARQGPLAKHEVLLCVGSLDRNDVQLLLGVMVVLRKHGVKFKIVSPDAATRERLDGKPSPPQKLGMRCQLVMLAGIPEGMRTVLFLSVYHASGENLALRLLMAEEDWAEEGGPKDIRHRNESGWHRPVKAPPPVVVAMQLGLVWHELYDTALSPPPPLPCEAGGECTFDQSAEAIGSKRKKPVSPSQPSSEADTDEDSTVGAGTSAHAGASTSADASAGAGTSASATAGAGTSASATAGAGTSASATAGAGASTSAAAGAPGPASSSARAAPSKPPRQVTLRSILSSTTTALQSRSVDVYE